MRNYTKYRKDFENDKLMSNSAATITGPSHDGIHKLKETIGDSKKRAKGIQAIIWFAEELDKLKSTEFSVQCGLVYGSFARGAKRFQQIDMLLVLEKNVDEVEAFHFIIDNIFTDIYLETGIYFYLDVVNPEKLQIAHEQPGPLFHRIQKEGIVFYGRDVLHQE
jgi:histidinol dehydrogenase